MADSSTVSRMPTDDIEMESIANPIVSSSTDPGPPTTSLVTQEKQGKRRQKDELAIQHSRLDTEETEQALISDVGETVKESEQETGGVYSSETRSGKRLSGDKEISEDGQMNPLSESRESSQTASDESLLDATHEKEVTREEDCEEEEDEMVSTPRKRKSGRQSKHSKSEGGATKRKRQDCHVGEDTDEMDHTIASTPKKKKAGRPPMKSPPKSKDDIDTDTPTRGKRFDANTSQQPGTKLKVCSHCGTVAEKVRAKKCYICKKFYLSQRCKIPPCPKCHFSRISRRTDYVPSSCEKCGFKFPSELLDESTFTSKSCEDRDGAESLESASTSVRCTPDPAEVDSLSNEGSGSKQMVEEVDNEYLNTKEEEEEVVEEIVVQKKGKGKAKGDKERVEQKRNSPEVENLNVACRARSVGSEGVIVATATTRSGRPYKHDTTPERTYGGLIASGHKADSRKPLAQEDVQAALNVPSSQQKAPSQEMKTANATDNVKDLPQDPDHAQGMDHSSKVQTEEETPLKEMISTFKQSLASDTAGDIAGAGADTVPLSHAETHSTVPSSEHNEKGYVGKTVTPVKQDRTQQSTIPHDMCAAEVKVDKETQATVCVDQPEFDIKVVNNPSAEGNKGTRGAEHIDSISSKVLSSSFRTDEAECGCIRHTDSQHSITLEGNTNSLTLPNTTTHPFTQSSAVQTVSGGGDFMEDTGKEGSSEGDRSVCTIMNNSLSFLTSVLSGLQASDIQPTSKAQSVPAMRLTHTPDATSASHTSNLGSEDVNRSRVDQATFSGGSIVTMPLSSFSLSSDQVSAVEVNTAIIPPATSTAMSASVAVCDRDADMVVTESGTLTVTGPGATKSKKQNTTQKASKGKKAAVKDGKSTATKKKRQPKSQEKTAKEKPVKPKKPRAKKSKSMTASAPSVTDDASSAAISMLATSIAAELQRRPSLSSPPIASQHSKHSFSQYFYSEDGKLATMHPGTGSSTSGGRGSDSFQEGFSERTKRSPPHSQDSHEPPLKKKKLANIAPNTSLTSTASTTGNVMGPQSLRATLAPLMTPALLPQLCQLAATLKMSSSSLLSLLQSVLPPQKSSSTSSSGANVSGMATVSSLPSAAPNPSSLAPNLFPPLTMSFQSLAAALSNMPISTTPIRLSGTQVTARPLLPSTVPSSMSATPFPSVTSASLSTVFPTLGTTNTSISNEQLATLKGVFAQSEASVGTQTAVKIDTLKPLLPAGPSSLSPQLLSLPNPPQLTPAPVSSSSTPPLQHSFTPKDLKPAFQSALSNQLPSAPPPLTSSHPTHPISTPRESTTASAVPFPVIQSHTTATSYMTLPVSAASTVLPFLPVQSNVIPLPGRGVMSAQMTSGDDGKVHPLLLSSLPETTSQPLSVTPESVLPPPPHLLPQPGTLSPPSSSYNMSQSYVLDTASESAIGGSSSLLNPIIPSLLRPGMSLGAMSTSDQGAVSGLALSQHPFTQQKVIYTQSVTSPKVCPGPQQTCTGTRSVDSNLQVLASNVQTRISEALSKTSTDDKPPEPHPLLLPTTTTTTFPLAPPPLTPSVTVTFVSKGNSSNHPQYILPHPPPQKKRGVVITKLPGPLSSAFSHTGEFQSREGSRHSCTSSLKAGEDASLLMQNAAAGSDAMFTEFSSPHPTVITLSPSPTESLEEQHVLSGGHRKQMEHDSDKESDSYAKLMSEETLGSDPSSDGEGVMREEGGVCDGAGDQQPHSLPSQSSSMAFGTESKKGRKKERERDRNGDGGGREGEGDKGKGSKKRRKSSSGASGKKSPMFSVKLKDCYLHHLTWMDYRMVLLVPLGEKQKYKHKHKLQQQHNRHKQQQTPHQKHTPEAHVHAQTHSTAAKSSGGGGGGKEAGGERRRRRKPILKELSTYNDMEEDEDDASQSTTSSLHVPGPCFSVYELRNKLFQTLSPNAVYIYTYKNQIKSFKLPIHWVYILKRMGGMLDSCHTCRLMDLEHVRGMCSHYGLSLPDTLNSLCRNELPKGRKVIDLSGIEPESLGPLHLEEIPPCTFTEKGRPYKPKTKKNKKKWRKEEEHRGRRKSEHQEKEKSEKKLSEDHGEVQEVDDTGKAPQASASSLPDTSLELEEEEVEGEGGEGGERGEGEEGEGEGGEEMEEGEMEGEGEMVDEWTEEWKQSLKYQKRSPPPLIKHSPSSYITGRAKKKPCPYCGAQVLKRSKKCSVCNRNFGIYTFGRKQCMFCGRVNQARMARCQECSQSLDKAPSARPKDDEGSSVSASSSHKKSDFIFGVRKRRKVHSVPLAFSGTYHQSYMSSKTRKSSERLQSPEGGRGQRELTGEEEMEEEEGRREEGEEEEEEEGEGEGEGEEGGEEEEVLTNKPADAETAKPTPKSRTKFSSSAKTKHASYQYGHIPWADADITVLVDERGLAKFCLQELIAKVLVGHTKAEVFEMVHDLDLPLEQGNVQLLKKLQALGLHANRSPMCKLIASEELWLLLDALQEPVPEEVHQHLENINTSTTPLLSPGGAVRSPAVVAAATVTPTPGPEEEEQQTTSFDSTLHEMQCSDSQYISVLRKWSGEEFACLPEIWRKYFPEVNRNHLSSALRRLMLETHMPTAQQATLLRSAQVISIRGAPGRLMKLEDMQTLLDDFCIPLQLATGHSQKHSMAKPPQKPPAPSAPKPVSRPVGRPRIHSNSSYPTTTAVPPGKVLANKEDVEYAQCMRHVLTAVQSSDLVALLENTRLTSERQAEHADSEAAELDSKLDQLSQLIHSRRELSTVLSREMGFLNASVHGYMSEIVRLSHSEKLVLQNLDSLLHSMNFSLL